eukprot:768429-Hanusia_phi.AAC.11
MQPRITAIFEKAAENETFSGKLCSEMKKAQEHESNTRKTTGSTSLFDEILNADWRDKKRFRETAQERTENGSGMREASKNDDKYEGEEAKKSEEMENLKNESEGVTDKLKDCQHVDAVKHETTTSEEAAGQGANLQIIEQSDQKETFEEQQEGRAGAGETSASSQVLTQEFSQLTQDYPELTQDSVQPTQEYQGNVFEPLIPASQEDLAAGEGGQGGDCRPAKRRRIRASIDSSDEDEEVQSRRMQEETAEELPDLSDWRVRMELLLKTARTRELVEVLGRGERLSLFCTAHLLLFADVAARYLKASRSTCALPLQELEVGSYENLQRILLRRLWEGRDFKCAR